LEINSLIPNHPWVIEAYGNGGFRIAGQRYDGNRLLFRERNDALPARTFAEFKVEHLEPLWTGSSNVDLLLIGCGGTMEHLSENLRESLKTHGVGVDSMDTSSACRTYNILLSEERLVAAVLFSV